jgi:hypothetical protein
MKKAKPQNSRKGMSHAGVRMAEIINRNLKQAKPTNIFEYDELKEHDNIVAKQERQRILKPVKEHLSRLEKFQKTGFGSNLNNTLREERIHTLMWVIEQIQKKPEKVKK